MESKSNSHLRPLLVIDIGGTNFRSCIFFPKKGLTKNPIRVQTPNFINNPGLKIAKLQMLLIEKVLETLKRYQKNYPDLDMVALSFPAPITPDGIVNQACTIWGDRGKNFPLLKKLQECLPQVHFVIANDVTAAAERYANMKKYQKVDYFVVITVSSGIGSKIYDVKNRSVVLDKRSIGGEMGHIRVDFSKDAPQCDCGGKGHLGALSSGRAVERLVIANAKKFPDKFKRSCLYKMTKSTNFITNLFLVEAIKMGDKFSLEILDEATFPLACSIAHISGNIGADKYIIIGGFALNCGDRYIESLRKNLFKIDFYSREKEEIPNLVELGINDDNDCLIGIGLLAQKSL